MQTWCYAGWDAETLRSFIDETFSRSDSEIRLCCGDAGREGLGRPRIRE